MSTAIEFNNISKQYRLGVVSTHTLSHDLNRWWTVNILRKEDPYLKIGDTNDRTSRGDSEYVWALKDIDFKVEQGDVVGIIGKNGAGKSTLLKILSKITGPTAGTIRARGRIGSLLEVGTGFHQEMTGRENIYLNGAIMGMSKDEITRKLDEIVDFSGCERYIDTPVKRYSSGMTVRLGFAVAAFLEPEILVVDEVLAVGDAEFQKKAIGKMQDVSRGEGRTVLFVSHNMASIRVLCNHGVLLENGMIKSLGKIEDIVDQYLMIGKTNKGEPILKAFSIIDRNLSIESVKINNSETNRIEMNICTSRVLNVIIKGSYQGKIPIDIEFGFYSDMNVLLAKRARSLFDEYAKIVDNEEFVLSDEIVLPEHLTNGTYYLQIDITHPKVSYLARAENALRIDIVGNTTSQGVSIDARDFGMLYL